MLKKKNSGLTLIELVVVSAILLMAGVVLVSSFFSITKSNTKAELMKVIRQNGDYALSTMEKIITGGFVDSCDGDTHSTITVRDEEGNETVFSCLGDPVYIASSSSQLTDNDLIQASNCQFQCEAVGNYQKVTISFTLENIGSSSRQEEKASQHFQKVILVRNRE